MKKKFRIVEFWVRIGDVVEAQDRESALQEHSPEPREDMSSLGNWYAIPLEEENESGTSKS